MDANSVEGSLTEFVAGDMLDENNKQLGLSKDETKIELYTAQKMITEGTANLWKAYTMVKGEYKALQGWEYVGGANEAVSYAYVTTKQMKDGLDLYIVAKEAGVVLGWKDTHKVVSDEVIRKPVGAGLTDDANPADRHALTGVWKWRADKALKADSFETLVTVTMSGSVGFQDQVSSSVTLKDITGGTEASFGGTNNITAGEHKLILKNVTVNTKIEPDYISIYWEGPVTGMTISDKEINKDGNVTLTITVEDDAAVTSVKKVGRIMFGFGEEITIPITVEKTA